MSKHLGYDLVDIKLEGLNITPKVLMERLENRGFSLLHHQGGSFEYYNTMFVVRYNTLTSRIECSVNTGRTWIYFAYFSFQNGSLILNTDVGLENAFNLFKTIIR